MAMGLLHPYGRWMWIGSILVIVVGAGWFNGYVTARCMKSAGLSDWIGGATFSAFVYPLMSMCCFVIMDLIEWAEKADAVPLTSMLIYCAVWMVLNVAACYHGSTKGFCAESWASERKPNPVKRKIPSQPWWLDLKILMPLCGSIIFTCVFVEFNYIWISVWRKYLFAMYWALYTVMGLLIFVIAEISIVVTYVSLQY